MTAGGARRGRRAAPAGRARALCVAALACVLGACGAQVAVVQGVPESEANRVVGALDQAGIASHKEADEGTTGAATFHVAVGSDDVARAVGVLNAQGMPRRTQAGFAETYGQASLVQTASEERARATQAIAGELARTMEAIDGVLEARVHLSIPDTRERMLDEGPPLRATASVLLHYAGARPPYDDDGIRRLVAGAVSGMRPEDVSVMGSARTISPPPPGAGVVWVGPIAVARGSASTLRAALAALLALNLALCAALIVVAVRKKRAEPAAGGAPGAGA